jgi:hypothetical protein
MRAVSCTPLVKFERSGVDDPDQYLHSQMPDPHRHAERSRRGLKPRWYFLYFLLAAFDVVTVSTSLFLNHR